MTKNQNFKKHQRFIHWKRIVVFYQSNAELTFSFGTLFRCINLKKLYCSHNKLRELPDSLSQCHNLREIRVGYNSLINIPESFGNLVRLQTLIIHKNQLEFLPEVRIYFLFFLSIFNTEIFNCMRSYWYKIL